MMVLFSDKILLNGQVEPDRGVGTTAAGGAIGFNRFVDTHTLAL